METHCCTKCMATAIPDGKPSKKCEDKPHNFVPLSSWKLPYYKYTNKMAHAYTLFPGDISLVTGM